MARSKKKIDEETFPCAHCGADVRASAEFCRACGASEGFGWGEEEFQEEDDFDYDEYVLRESGASGPWTWKGSLVAVIILLCCLAILLTQIGW